jgi:hypothetical protein
MLRRQWVQDRDGFLLVYSMTDRRSFDELSSFVSLIRTTKGNKQLPIIVVANKSDLKVPAASCRLLPPLYSPLLKSVMCFTHLKLKAAHAGPADDYAGRRRTFCQST